MLPTPSYDPRVRPWYLRANEAVDVVATAPYVFSTSGATGVTFARRIGGAQGSVFGADVTLAVISEFLSGLQDMLQHAVTVTIFDELNRVIVGSHKVLEGQRVEFLEVDDLGDPAVRIAVDHFFDLGRAYGGATLQTPTGVVAAAVHEMPFALGEGRQYIATVVPLEGFVGPLLATASQSLFISLVIAILAVPVVALFSRRLAWPLRRLAEDADRVRNFDVDEPLDLRSRIVEVRDLIRSATLMKSTLSAFAKYVPRDLVRGILNSDFSPDPGGERRPVTLLFTDIEDFTPLCERMDPMALMIKISEYLSGMVSALQVLDGTVDKFVGDAIMAYWNAPEANDDHVALGCRAALACREISNSLNQDWESRGEAPLYTRFGLHTGDTVVGNVGSDTRLDFTVMGASVNLAARLEGLNKFYGTQIMASQQVRENAGPGFLFRPVDLVRPKGTVIPTRIYELVGATGQEAEALPGGAASDQDLARCAAWEAVYSSYMARDWSGTIAAVGDFSKSYPADPLADVYLKRAWVYLMSPPDDSWDGVETHLTK